MNNTVTDLVFKLTEKYKIKGKTFKSRLGQYFTPIEIVRYILDQIDIKKQYTNFLDPAAGLGNLLIPVIEYLVEKTPLLYAGKRLDAYLFEIDSLLIADLEVGLTKLKEKLKKEYDVGLEFHLICGDFLSIYHDVIQKKIIRVIPSSKFEDFYEKDNSFSCFELPASFDFIILNPPYGKLNTKDIRSRAIREFTNGHTNLYTAFLGYCKILCRSNIGVMISIIPRSFCNGIYFKKFRQFFTKNHGIRTIGIIEQRDVAFSDQNVLQENIILITESRLAKIKVAEIHVLDNELLSHSLPHCYRLSIREKLQIKITDLITKLGHVIRIPSNRLELSTIEKPILNSRLIQDLGCKVSTGQIVQHRSKRYLISASSTEEKEIVKKVSNGISISAYPLILANHIKPNQLVFPRNDLNGKVQFIHHSLLVDKMNYVMQQGFYVVLRRISSKNDEKRVIATMITPHDFQKYKGMVFDNKVNYISIPPEIPVPEQELIAKGILNYISSIYFELKFRSTSGSTQVNASDFDVIEFPNKAHTIALGKIPFKDKAKVNQYIDHLRVLKI